jgi:hypothetical protein
LHRPQYWIKFEQQNQKKTCTKFWGHIQVVL